MSEKRDTCPRGLVAANPERAAKKAQDALIAIRRPGNVTPASSTEKNAWRIYTRFLFGKLPSSSRKLAEGPTPSGLQILTLRRDLEWSSWFHPGKAKECDFSVFGRS